MKTTIELGQWNGFGGVSWTAKATIDPSKFEHLVNRAAKNRHKTSRIHSGAVVVEVFQKGATP